jgi:4'-phosphopantetheinyl transferase
VSTVHVWRIPIGAGAPGLRDAVRAILGAHLDIAPSELRFGTGPYGKPFVRGAPVEFNLSHTTRAALLAVSARRPVGVDLATCRPDLPVAALAARWFPPAERDLVRRAGRDARLVWLRLWARKEALVKAAGSRLAVGLPVPVAGSGAGRRYVAGDPTGRVPGVWSLLDLPAPPGYAACVALAGPGTFEVVRHTWRC